MIKRGLNRKIFILSGLFSSFEIDKENFENYKKARGLYIEDNWERVKLLFQKDENGNFHPEMENAFSMTQYGLVCGGILGGINASNIRIQNFIKNNDTNLFMTRNEALKKLSAQSTLGFLNGFFKYAPRYGAFMLIYCIFSSSVELYRNKTGIIENTIAGCGGGIIFRSHFGLKGMVAGGIVGGTLGTIYGLIVTLLTKVTDINTLELKYAHLAYINYKKQLERERRTNMSLKSVIPEDINKEEEKESDYLKDI